MIYGVSSSGATLYMHYCCGKLVDIEISSNLSHCGDKHKNGSHKCCETKLISSSKASYDYFPSILKFQYSGIINYQVFEFSNFEALPGKLKIDKKLPDNLPPPIPIYISKRSFLI